MSDDLLPESADGLPDRRRFLLRMTLGAAAALAWPRRLEQLAAQVASTDPADTSDDFWRQVRAHFLIPDDRIYLNVGTLGPQPRVVVDAVVEHTRRVAMTLPPAVDWDALKARLGALLNCDPAGLAFPRNTTEGMNFIANGLDLRAGDDVLTTDHEHVGGLSCWQLIAARRGVRLRQLPLPVPPSDPDQVVQLFRKAIGRRTRVISVSHVNFTNGLVMPVRELVQLCRERGLVAVVDGAHPPGLMGVDIRAIDPDFYASSPHKWLLAAQGTGFLYMREEWRTKLWPTIASGDWNDQKLGAHRFNHLGTIDESRFAGLDAALRFHELVGTERVQNRIRELRDSLAERVAGLRGVTLVSPSGPQVAGMVSFKLAAVESLELQKRLAEKGNVRTRVIGEYNYGWMRLTPHIYNMPEELERVVELIAADGRVKN